MSLKGKTLLAVVHAPSPKTLKLVRSFTAGARRHGASDIEIRVRSAFLVMPDDVRSSDLVVIFTTENFGTTSGAMKDFFDRVYYPCLEKTQGMPYAAFVRAGLDGAGTLHALKSVIGGLKWKPVQKPVLLQGEHQKEFEEICSEAGETLVAGLEMGIF